MEGSIRPGSSLGVFYGFLFTLLPLLVLAWAVRKRRSWKAWLVLRAAAIVLALPNLFTLGIVLGRGNAAHAGERTLDVEAPGFRGGHRRRRDPRSAVPSRDLVAPAGLVGTRVDELDRARSEERDAAQPPAPDA